MRYSWLLVPLGLITGFVAGLYLAWNVWFPLPTAADIAQLRRPERIDYARLIAAGYADDGDLRAARDRLSQLEVGNARLWIADLARQEESAARFDDARRLARLAYALGVTDPSITSLAAPPLASPGSGNQE